MHYTPSKNEQLAASLGFRISEDGTIVTHSSGKAITLSTDKDGYKEFSFGPKANRKKCRVHRFNAWFRFGEAIYEPNIVCRHLDGNPSNNHINNIALGTQHDNIMDRPAEERRLHAWNTSRHATKHDHVAIIEFYKQHGFKATLFEFGISSKGTLSFIINKTQTAKPVAKTDRPKRQPRKPLTASSNAPATDSDTPAHPLAPSGTRPSF